MHNIITKVYDENVDKNKIEKRLNQLAKEDGDYGGLPHPIRWIDHTCSNEDVARDYINHNDNGWYDQIAVKFLDYPTINSSTKENLMQRRKEWCDKLNELRNKIHYANVKSNFVSCQKCESKINRKFIKWNICPICRTDMRPKSTLDLIARYEQIIKDIDKQLKEEELRLQEKAKKKAIVKWLVKIEYHS